MVWCYPEVVIADKVYGLRYGSRYGSRDNRSFLKQRNIRFADKRLGRPPKITHVNEDDVNRQKAQHQQGYWQWIPIEGKFGQGKYGFRLNNIRARRVNTSIAWINSIFLVMNLLVVVLVFIGLKEFVIKIAIWTKNTTMLRKIVLEYNCLFVSSRNLAWQ